MPYQPIRWLHLSDFHIGKDDYGQRQMFLYILNEIGAKIESGFIPDIVFITGDIANYGLPSEYEYFIDLFIYPLMELLDRSGRPRIYIVPGNHDVDRTQAKAVQKHDVLLKLPQFLDPTLPGLQERKDLLSRFGAYIKADLPDIGGKWLNSSEGAFIDKFAVSGLNIGILGINTAWLSENNYDRHKLSPGKGIVETALEVIKDCDVRIVLGHHPIDWFIDDEIRPIRSMFGKNNVIYLHGHLHRNESTLGNGAGHLFLIIQAGASFQAREHELWVNRLLWCELDPEKKQIEVKPRQWSKDNQEWVIDPSYPEEYRIPNTDRWVLHLPDSRINTPSISVASRDIKELTLPSGWLLADRSFLARQHIPLLDERVLRYFDGRVPVWEDALSDKIPRRAIVHEITSDLNASRQIDELRVTLLLGAGGEGKSTALRQITCDLVNSDTQWQVLWHNNPDTSLPIEFLLNFAKSTQTWLIVSDDADLIARDVFDSVQALHKEGRKNIQFLLSCRDTDWIGAKAEQLPWREYTTFVEKRLRGLSLEDAALIVKAWKQYGNLGMGRLSNLQPEEAAKRLVEESKSENYVEEGAFLGAMLRTRLAEDIKSHVTDLLTRLDKRPSPGGTLMNAFACIASLHAENYLVLSKPILAEVIGCKLRDVKREIIGPLGEEAAAAPVGQLILTRHRAIAEVAVEILSNKFHLDFEEIFVELVRAAHRLKKNNEFVPKLGEWYYLASHVFQKGNQVLGIRLAKILVDTDSSNPFFLTQLARLLREAGHPEQSVQLFWNAPIETRSHRTLYLEWGTAEGSNKNKALDAWLAGVALADSTHMKRLSTETPYTLANLAFAFSDLFDIYKETVFIEACGAAAQLGLMLPSNWRKPENEKFLQRSQMKSKEAGVKDVDPSTSLRKLEIGITRAWELREDELPQWVLKGNELVFQGLAQLLRIDIESAL
jgi:hypothetical protein